MNRGKLIVVSAPSGSGKTTIAKKILEKFPFMKFSVSATTRPKRNGEVDGKDYFFLSREEFEKKIQNGELLEWEEIYGNYYGTLKSVVESALKNGDILVFDVDVNGAISIKEKFPEDSVLIFIKPPNMETLKERLKRRKTESEEQIKRRLERVPMELEKAKYFDYIFINDNLESTVKSVVRAIFDEIEKWKAIQKHEY
ncbi:guanylate kinase [Candidatus Kryptonium thompsonii]|mgnify:CR=1 FL=1|uniref:Guanylate kinase n=2 Tax=Candidatus Kryptonium thompsonii TaxID=1633631 RepID=A0A0P1NWR1_9BACT|nr:guanylate kinase [Candidatus Kryptonium thompsoni]CUS77736.1 guanylate kinase [Candidatus Kryptonium thompsoni]CUS90704.1 guanylate kinase [Candidatus Kryptonium thompsoni]CUS93412.1 guanylate kinase [Candidatus Kryptonium thompsoni]CUS94959.1 guanylate kinase [Candidatus Kryptonium thompsoni]CUT03697.1 guanylate kinase [Candidatus Kryptonium thompsoni]